MRLNNFIGASGLCSRREADALIKAGRVKVNGKPAQLGQVVEESDVVHVDGKEVHLTNKHIYILLNKPAGITCTTERHIKGNIVDYIGIQDRIFPVGRLDKASEGLILLTSDGSIVNAILRVENDHDKEYSVMVNKPYTKEFVEKMRKGVKIFNPVKKVHVVTNSCEVKPTGPRTFNITLNQGLNRQIRRMCSALGYEVTWLRRIRIMHIQGDGLKVGKWRHLSQAELNQLMESIGNEK